MERASLSSATGRIPRTVPDCSRLVVGGIPRTMSQQTLRTYFEKYGEVASVYVSKVCCSFRGFGYIRFVDPAMDQIALDEKEHILHERKLQVSRVLYDPNNGANNKIHVRWDQMHDQNCSLITKIYAHGSPSTLSGDALRSYFEQFGPIVDAVFQPQNIQFTSGFGFIVFEYELSVKDIMAVRDVHAHWVCGTHVQVKIDSPKQNNSHNQHFGARSYTLLDRLIIPDYLSRTFETLHIGEGASPSSSRPVPDCRKLFIGGIPRTVSQQTLRTYFERYGEVVSAYVPMEICGRFRGFGFVHFAEPAIAQLALDEEEHVIHDSKVEVKRAWDERHDLNSIANRRLDVYWNQVHDQECPLNNKKSVCESPSELSADVLRSYFEQFGPLQGAHFLPFDMAFKSGLGFIAYEYGQSVKDVMEISFRHMHFVSGTHLQVKISPPPRP